MAGGGELCPIVHNYALYLLVERGMKHVGMVFYNMT